METHGRETRIVFSLFRKYVEHKVTWDLTVHNTLLFDVWNMLIKFSKQAANTFVKITKAAKTNSKLCQTSEMELFP